ncbi:hypothetical protein FISHEDRAFT_72917 [Fistulina hepatica ATCC 64428]|uniref:Uncharacterized protein n=1 Tax=Fistulina hepatica ATCC 64428 TaxID=1128425 RepID=A0A0D7AFI1_9AGAR|nr:hypothetical protein FISHEDRAFT_72917 [Fistulina hepatica ATCC 64428]
MWLISSYQPVHKLWTIILYPLNHHKQYLRDVAIADWIVLYKAESFIAVLLVISVAAWLSTRRAPSNGQHQIFDVVWSAATLYLLADLIPAGGVCVLALWRPKVALILTVLSPLRIGSKPALFAMASMTDSDSRRRQIPAPAPMMTTTTTASNDAVHNDATRYVGIKMGILSALFHFGVSFANLVHPLLIARDLPGLPRHLNVSSK